jgi:hypothetical protein
MLRLIMLRKPFVVLGLSLAVALCLGASASTSLAKSPSGPQIPLYSRLFEQARGQDGRGDWQGSLKTLSRIYETEVPVQAFYGTLERYKLKILASLSGAARLKTGRQSFTLQGLGQYFSEVLLPKPDRLHRDPRLDTELPLARLLQLYAVLGKDQPRQTGNPLLEPAAPHMDLKKVLASLDPWLVSAGLFLARKGQGRIDPGEVIKRWQYRPDLWDQVCTHQALLYFAGLPSAQFKNLRLPSDFPPGQAGRFKPIPPGHAPRARLLSYWRGSSILGRDDYLQAAGCSALLIASKQVKWQKYVALNPAKCRRGYLTLPSGWYSLRYLDGQATGKTRPFNLQRGILARVVIVLQGQI